MPYAGAVLTIAFGFSLTASWWDDDVHNTIVWHSYPVIALVVMIVGLVRLSRGDRFPWLALTVGLGAWVAGDVAWDVVSWNAPLPDLSIVDAFYLGGYAALLVGLALLTLRLGGRLPFDAVIDGLILLVALGSLVWVGLIAPGTYSGSLGYRLVTISYPLAALGLLLGLAWLCLHPERRRLPAGSGLIALALVMLPALELTAIWYYLYEPNLDLDLEPVIDRGFHLGFGLLALAPFARPNGRNRPDRTRLHPLRLVMLGAALLTGPITLVVADDARTVAVGSAALVSALVLVRFAGLSRARERARADLAHQATHDVLTGLANRAMLLDALYEAVAAHDGRSSARVALLAVDVDRFKSINDTHGHAAGDAVLIELAERIRRSIRPGDIAARLGGDEFVVLCENVDSPADARVVADRVRAACVPPFQLGGDRSASISVSVGVAHPERDPIDIDELLTAADAALYHVKRTGRDGVAVYDERIEAMTLARRIGREELELALREHRVSGQLTDIVEARSGMTAARELCVRLERPSAVGVDLDLELDDGFGDELSIAVAARLLDDLAETGDDPTAVFLWLPAGLMGSASLLSLVADWLPTSAEHAHRLVLESSEEGLRTATTEHPDLVAAIRSMGARLALRDFGGRGSSLGSLDALPVDVVRIDVAPEGWLDVDKIAAPAPSSPSSAST